MDQSLESLNVVEKLELTTQKPATSSLPAHPEPPRIMSDTEQNNQKGGTPT